MVGDRPCMHGHDAGRYRNGICKTCARNSASAWTAKNPERSAANKAKYYRANREKALASTVTWRAANPDKVDANRRKAVGHPDPTRQMPETCECCGKTCDTGRRLALDHCYETGQFRGWLCMKCNTGIGKLGDSLEDVLRAVAYLQRARQ